jgi:[protein-PII] uridylyltransferase
LRELFERTSEFIETGSDDLSRAVELIEGRVEVRRHAAAAELSKLGIAESKIDAYFEMMPRRYFISHAPRQIARHALVVLGLAEGKIMSTAYREMRGGFSEMILCTKDVHALYSRVAGVLTAHNINILGSNVYTSHSGLALEIYRVSTPPGGEGERQLAWKEFERSLEAVLAGGVEVEDLIRNRGRRIGGKAKPARQGPVKVRVTNSESDFYTIADVTANDRLGLLHALTQVIADRDLEIYISKAATVLDQVQDTFYLKTEDGKKLMDPEALNALRIALIRAAEGDGEPE